MSKVCGCKGIRSCALCKQQQQPTATDKSKSKSDGDVVTVVTNARTDTTATENDANNVYDEKVTRNEKNDFDFDTEIINQAKSRGFFIEPATANIRWNNNWMVNDDQVNYEFCPKCARAHLSASVQDDKTSLSSNEECSHTSPVLDFTGVQIFPDFVTPGEEDMLVKTIGDTPYVNSQSGRRKQDFGPKVNFKKKKLKPGNFCGLPSYSRWLYERMRCLPGGLLGDFIPVEMCNLEYCESRGAHIDPHVDDQWLWGERLVTLNLLSDSVLTFTHPNRPLVFVRVPLVQRSLLVVSQSARHDWLHAIEPAHVTGKRIAMTFRELSDEFRREGPLSSQGTTLVDLALTFKGVEIHQESTGSDDTVTSVNKVSGGPTSTANSN